MADTPLPESEQEGSVASDDAHLDDVWMTAMQRFDSVAPAQIELRAISLRDRRFVTIEGAMWEDEYWSIQFENMPRPEIDKITPSLEKILTDYRENRLIADFIPANDSADEDTADTLDGMYRADSHDFASQEARDNAVAEAVQGGFGAYRLTTDLADEYDPENDSQRVNPGVIIVDADQSVYFDPSDKSYGKRKAKWAFIVISDPRLTAIEKWGEENLSDFDSWQSSRWRWRDWYTLDTVRTAEYYVVEDNADTLVILTNDLTSAEQRYFRSEVEPSQISDLVAQGWSKRERKAKRKRVRKYIMNGTRILKDCGYIAGDRIPIVPVYGRRDFVDGMERWRGHVRKMVDAQRVYNASVAKVTETQAMAPYEVPIVAPEQLTPTIAEQWARGNIDRTPFRQLLPIRGEDGSVVTAGPIGKIDPPQVQPATATLLQIADANLSAQDDPNDEVKANVSADAMDIAASRVDAKSAMYLDNMRQSIAIEGEIYLGMAREVYYEPGRKVATLTQDDKNGTATLAEPVIGDNGVFRIRNDLQAGHYKVVADVQESTATMRQKTVRVSLNGATVAGQLGAQDLGLAYLLTAIMNQDGEGMGDLQAFARNKGIGIGLVKPTPEEQQQIQQAQQAAQGQQQVPAPADQALVAQASKFASDAKLSEARAADVLADAHLKAVQAETLSKVPRSPTGLQSAVVNPELQAANDQADIIAKHASAELDSAKAAHLTHDMHNKRIRTGMELSQQQHDQQMAERQQDHAERVAGQQNDAA